MTIKEAINEVESWGGVEIHSIYETKTVWILWGGQEDTDFVFVKKTGEYIDYNDIEDLETVREVEGWEKWQTMN